MLTDEEFRLFRNLIYEESGMFLKEGKKDFLETRLARRMRETKVTTPYWYYRFLMEHRTAELLILLDCLTINETSFFRNTPQFDLFRNTVLPDIRKRREREIARKIRIWSAGCATGEEPYSIAIELLEAIPDATAWDIRIFASDLSLTALGAAARGVYAPEKAREAVPPPLLAKYFTCGEDGYRVTEQIRRLVAFDYHNLKHENGMDGMDAIFCRNVMIYFDEEEQKRLAAKFRKSLVAGGYLLLGHAESLQGWGLDLRFIFDQNGTAYQKPGGG